MKFLLKLALVLAIALVGYNYFLGNEAEKENSREIIQKVEELGVSIGKLIKSEKQKYDEGKYEDALANVNSLISSLKEKISDLDLTEKLKTLEEKKDLLKEKIKDIDSDQISSDQKEDLDKGLEELLKDLEQMTEKY